MFIVGMERMNWSWEMIFDGGISFSFQFLVYLYV